MGMTIDISDGMLELTLYKFKKWLGSVPRELQNRQIKHKPYKRRMTMGMSIDEIIQGIQIIKAQAEWDYPLDWQIVLDGAIDTMRKYQRIEQIVNNYISSAKPYISVIDEDIRKVLEDGKID